MIKKMVLIAFFALTVTGCIGGQDKGDILLPLIDSELLSKLEAIKVKEINADGLGFMVADMVIKLEKGNDLGEDEILYEPDQNAVGAYNHAIEVHTTFKLKRNEQGWKLAYNLRGDDEKRSTEYVASQIEGEIRLAISVYESELKRKREWDK